jgi:CheY-like chemotaxis protein
MNRTILMLEHDDDDRYITQSVFDENNYGIKINFVNSSPEVFAYLNSCEKNGLHYPSLILLNYYAIPTNAVEILKELKDNSKYCHIPVVILSGTVNDDVIKECYAARASSFIQKPFRSDETSSKIASFIQYWFGTVELP